MKRRGVTFLELMIMLAIVSILAAIIVPNFIKAHSGGRTTACKSNLKNIGTALEMYSTDFSGHFPSSLVRLTPNYLRIIPVCPSAGTDTYSAGYRQVQLPKDAYTFYCEGLNHTSIGISTANYPQYNSQQGLVERP